MRAEYLESTGSQYIDPLHVPSRQFGYEIKVTVPLKKITTAGFIWGCQTSSGGRRLWMQIKPNDTGEVAWGTGTVNVPLNGGLIEQTFSMNYKTNNLCILDEVVLKDLWNMGFDPVYHFTLFKSTFASNTNFDPTIPARIFLVKFSEGNEIIRNLIPALDPTGIPCMFDTVTGQPFRNGGTGQFITGLTLTQALNLAYLPATGGSLTVSLPLEAAFDANVQSALNTAADKGWTITVQYRESELTTKNIPADFLESTGTQGIQIPHVFDKNTGIECEGIMPIDKYAVMCYVYLYYDYRYVGLLYNKIEDSKIYVNEYGTSSNYNGTDVRLPNKEKRSKARYNWKNDKILYINNGETSTSKYNDKYVKGYTSNIIGVFYNERFNSFYAGVTYSVSVSQYENVVINLIPTLDSSGTPCMYDTVSGQNFYNANTAEGATPFIVGFDTTEKAAISISKLPRTTGSTLTVSLPAEAEDAATRVPDAIEIATNRGWTIITQYRED